MVSSSTFRVQSKALWDIRVPLGTIKFRLHSISSREEQFDAFLCVILSIFQEICGFESFSFSLEGNLATTQASILAISSFVTEKRNEKIMWYWLNQVFKDIFRSLGHPSSFSKLHIADNRLLQQSSFLANKLMELGGLSMRMMLFWYIIARLSQHVWGFRDTQFLIEEYECLVASDVRKLADYLEFPFENQSKFGTFCIVVQDICMKAHLIP